MKTKHLIYALAFPLAFAACSDDAIVDSSSNPLQKGELITLGENFSLVGQRGDDASTRASFYDGTKFAWDDANDMIGLCWRGGEYVSNTSFVYTNYKFNLNGWLGKDEVTPDTDPCVTNSYILNGRLFSELATNETAFYAGTWPVYDATEYPNLNVDPKNGVFRTDASTIFKGDYVVYYPFNNDFVEVGNIPVKSPIVISRNVDGYVSSGTGVNYTRELATELVSAGKASDITGGQQAGQFSTSFVSGGIVLKIKNNNTTAMNLHKVVLIDANGFIVDAKLDADKIWAGKKGADTYAAEPVNFSQTIVASFTNSATPTSPYLTVNAGASQNIALPALPTTATHKLAGMKVLIERKDGKTALFDTDITEIKSLADGSWNVADIALTESAFGNNAYAFDTESLITQLTKHNDSQGKGQTIQVLGPITLDPSYTFTLPYPTGSPYTATLEDMFRASTRSIYINEDVTVKGSALITIPSDVQLVFKVVDGKTLTFETPIAIGDKGCCGDYPGSLILQSANGEKGKYAFGDITNDGILYLANQGLGVEVTANNVVNNAEMHAYTAQYTAGTANTSKITIASLVNNGDLDLAAQQYSVEWDVIDPRALTPQPLYVDMYVTNLQNAEDGAINVGAYTRLNVTGASTNAGDITVQSSGTGTTSLDGELCITGALSNSGTIENRGVTNVLGTGTLTNSSADAVIIDRVGSQFGGTLPNSTLGQYICDVDSQSRLGYALGAKMPTTTVRFIGGTSYDFKGLALGTKNFIVATTGITFSHGDKAATTIGGYLTVNDGAVLTLSGIQLTVNGPVTSNGTFTVNRINTSPASLETSAAFTANGGLNIAKGTYAVSEYVRTAANSVTIAKDAAATYNVNSYTDITGAITINGTFNRILSSGAGGANPAQVWCGSYTRGTTAVITNGYPQVTAK